MKMREVLMSGIRCAPYSVNPFEPNQVMLTARPIRSWRSGAEINLIILAEFPRNLALSYREYSPAQRAAGKKVFDNSGVIAPKKADCLIGGVPLL